MLVASTGTVFTPGRFCERFVIRNSSAIIVLGGIDDNKMKIFNKIGCTVLWDYWWIIQEWISDFSLRKPQSGDVKMLLGHERSFCSYMTFADLIQKLIMKQNSDQFIKIH